tara:strand:- start:116 stop:523 length:408 start_codon:yes stop_codon:yes gene_type:complete
MLGGGNPVVGSNPTGVGTSINYIGKHAFANSGSVDVDDNETTMINGQAPNNSYVVANIQLGCLASTSDDFAVRIKIDGENVMAVRMANIGQNYLYGHYPFLVVIPPSSKLEVTLQNFASSTAREWYAALEGEVYA